MKVFARLGRSIRKRLRRDPDFFLKLSKGVIHVGANTGQERDDYRKHDLDVLWIEPIPEVFEQLKSNLKGYPRQKAYCHLITDREDAEYDFHIANNIGQSSSILDFKYHKDIWPEVSYTRSVKMRSRTLTSFLERERIDLGRYDALVIDTQGSELLVLEGARPVLPAFRYIKTEAADFEAYAGCCRVDDIGAFLGRNGFREWHRCKVASHAAGGSYYEVLFKKVPRGEPDWAGLSPFRKAAAYLGEKF